MNAKTNSLPLEQRITNATPLTLHPLHIHMKTFSGEHIEAFAFNEMALLRASGQAVKVRIQVGSQVYLDSLMGDGVILCTPMGSGAYNYAAQGPMVPLNSNVLPLTPMNPCNPRRWPGALLPNHLPYEIDVLEPEKRPAQISIDGQTYVDIVHIHVHMSHKHHAHVLFDPEDTLNERLLKYQFDL